MADSPVTLPPLPSTFASAGASGTANAEFATDTSATQQAALVADGEAAALAFAVTQNLRRHDEDLRQEERRDRQTADAALARKHVAELVASDLAEARDQASLALAQEVGALASALALGPEAEAGGQSGSSAAAATPETVEAMGALGYWTPAGAALAAELARVWAPATALEASLFVAFFAVALKDPAAVAAAFAPGDGVQLFAAGELAAAAANLGGDAEGQLRPTQDAATKTHLPQASLGLAPGQEGWALSTAAGLRLLLAGAARPGEAPELALAQALLALTGRPAQVLASSGTSPAAVFAALSQANPPLALPVLARLRLADGQTPTLVVAGTTRAADGTPMVRLLAPGRLGEGLAAASEVWPLATLLPHLVGVVLPDGRPHLPAAGRHRWLQSQGGGEGCCLQGIGAVGSAAAGARIDAVRPQAGPTQERCFTCAVAQQLCVPQAG